MKKYLILLLIIFCLTLTGCTADYDDADVYDINVKEYFEKVPGEDNLYYATDTKIVYWIGGSYQVNAIGDDYATSYITVWYSENGKICRYDDGKIMEVEKNE